MIDFLTKKNKVTPPLQNIPQHVAIIMDGNGRWAKKRHLPRVEGHRMGARSVRAVLEESRRLGIRYVTLFGFSTENWNRPEEEVSALMKLFRHYLDNEVNTLLENGIRLRAIGDRSRLPAFVRESLELSEERTKNNSELDFILAVSYGAREELVQATRRVVQDALNGNLDVQDINEHTIQQRLYTADIPDPDLLIRTSDEYRISNFLLWQLAYSEIVITPVLWPDFNAEEYRRCLVDFSQRNRRFGLTEDQVVQGSAQS